MDTSDDPVIDEGQRGLRKLDREARRVNEDIFESAGVPELRNPFSSSTERHEERASEAQAAQAIAQGPEATGPDFIRDFPSAIRKRKSKLAAASVMARDWLPPTLGTPGLFGVG